MRDLNGSKTVSGLWCVPVIALLVIAAVMPAIQSLHASDSEALPAATYSHGTLQFSIPYKVKESGSGNLIAQILDPEDHVLGEIKQPVEFHKGQGEWWGEIKLQKPLTPDELVWQRLRYRLADSTSHEPLNQTQSMSQIIRTPVIHILGQQSYLTGGEAAVRVIVSDSANQVIPGHGTVAIQLQAPRQKPRLLFSGPLNHRGTTEAQFHFPAGLAGSYDLHYVVDTAIGSAEFTQPVRLEDKASILLTTEKPIYQPGQTIHARVLALDRSNYEAVAGRRLVFEVEDSRGNKVFKKATRTDRFGVASAEFGLADEVNLGTYHLRALMGDGDAPTNNAEMALNVERYVLPKFKVAVEFADSNKRAAHRYRPGDHVIGTVRANYFFGKPVDQAEISVKASSMDVSVYDINSSSGKTDNDGTYHFDLHLPNYFAGRPLDHGAARVLIEATVKDSASHSETRGQPIVVSSSPLLITAVPEGGTLVPNLANQVFIVTSYADGTPAKTDLTVHAAASNQHASSDDGGVAVVSLPASAAAETLKIDADDKQGNQTSTTVPLQSRGGEDQILLRVERAVYRAGDRIQMKVFSTKERGTAYLDIVKEGQTVLTRDIDIEHGQAELVLTATPQMAGTLDFNAYLFGKDARPVGDHRLVFVQPADELKIEAATDGAAYKPGQDARIRFRVTNSHGEGVSAALGLQVVDEAVFALAEKQPGFAKVFFYLEQELMKPRYEIHSIGPQEIVEPADGGVAQQRDRAARALFAAAETVNRNQFQTEFGRCVPMTKYAAYFELYQKRFTEQAHEIARKLSAAYVHSPSNTDLLPAFNQLVRSGDPEFSDAWGTSLRLEPLRWGGKGMYVVRNAGPDKRFNTSDDLIGYLQVLERKLVGQPSSGPSSIDVSLEHDRGAMNGRSEAVGTVVDQWGRALEGAKVTLQPSLGPSRKAWTNAEGQFSLAALPAGVYRLTVLNGSRTLSASLKVEAGDRAKILAYFRNSSPDVMQSGNSGVEIAVMETGPRMLQREVDALAVNGVMGGIAGNGVEFDRLETFARLQTPPAVPMPVKPMNSAVLLKNQKQETSEPVAHARSYFPEALYINPEIITDKDGRASVTIPMADSITTWRMAMLASTARGALGTATSSVKVFQDFFVDLDMPVTLTQGDRISIPVAVYNYSGQRGDVDLQLRPANWFALVDDAGEKNVSVDSERVGGSQFTVEARRIGKYKLTLAARMKGDSERADIVIREIEVVPNGREQSVVFNGRLEDAVEHEVSFPTGSIPDASKIYVRLYPGPLSQVVEGMDAMLRMPYGCFEQTSSTTYPNVLALDYMKRTKKLTPEVHAKAEGFIATGYQRLLTFEVPGGGFSWFGNAPANKILTSYGLMEFYDMSKVHDVDSRLIQRTQQWLASQQQPDGSWKPDASGINEGATNRYLKDVLRITAYIAWSLENTGYQGPAIEKAKRFVESHMDGKMDSYTLAVIANFATDYQKDRDFTRQAMQLLLDARNEKGEQVWWTADETGVYATGASASVETTGLAVQALLKWGESSETTRKALSYVASKKDAAGTWGTTQATIMALRALLLSTEKGAADVHGNLEVLLNGKQVENLAINDDNNDLLHQFVLRNVDAKVPNTVQIRFDGKGGLAYQVVGSYFLPWEEKPANEAMSIDVAYDRTHLAQDDIATATATITNNLPKSANMVMVDLGIAPGFDLLSEDIQAYLEKSRGFKSGRLEKFNMTATQAILYFDAFAPGDTVKLRFRLRAKYPMRAKTFESRVYEYYDPQVSAVSRPIQLEVARRM